MPNGHSAQQVLLSVFLVSTITKLFVFKLVGYNRILLDRRREFLFVRA